jgi:uncharacterized tellurite resistance protein B-like protein
MHPDIRIQIRDLALLYLTMGQGTDDYLSGNEMEAITSRLHERYPDENRAAIQDIIGEVMALYSEKDEVMVAAAGAVQSLQSFLSPAQCAEILQDLLTVAEADGVLFENERSLLNTLAEAWGITPLQQAHVLDAEASGVSRWGVLHHLALIYIVLAHGVDNELSAQERKVILNKLREWQPEYTEGEVQNVLDQALKRYAQGVDDEVFSASVAAVKELLPANRRMAALNDLVKIANADGVFLDREEDLINQLLTAWEVVPYANYGAHGQKE